MTRVDELQRKYPSIPRELIVKYEVNVRGVRDSEVLSRTGCWFSSGESYNKDHDVTLKDLVQKSPEIVREGYILKPTPLLMRCGVGAMITRDSTSPYVIQETNSGRFALYEGEEKVEDVFFPLAHPDFEPDRALTSRGTLVSTLLDNKPSNGPSCVRMIPLLYCEYSSRGEQCKFCNFNAVHEGARALGVEHGISRNLEEIVEAYKIRSSQRRLAHAHCVMGGLTDSRKEASIFLKLAEGMTSGASFKFTLTVTTQPMGKKDMQRLRDSGLDAVMYDMEVWDPVIFAEVCPGKARRTGHEGYKEALLEAVDVFGVGNAGSNFVTGVTLLASKGHRTWQDARDSMVEGNRWMIKNGVVAGCSPFRWAPGSVYSQDPSNRLKEPPTELILEVALAHDEAMKECGLYKKMNKLLFCTMDGHMGYSGEIGMLAQAGDMGRWLADTVPDEANWIAKFVASVK